MFKLFAGASYYPDGGYRDFKGNFDTLDEAIAEANKDHYEIYQWWHIVKDDKAVLVKEGLAGERFDYDVPKYEVE